MNHLRVLVSRSSRGITDLIHCLEKATLLLLLKPIVAVVDEQFK